MTDRIPCCVPFCKRTASREKFPYAVEIICGKHWRMAPATWRRRRSLIQRKYTRRFGDNNPIDFEAGSPERITAVRMARICNKLWDRCKARAIEAATGIG